MTLSFQERHLLRGLAFGSKLVFYFTSCGAIALLVSNVSWACGAIGLAFDFAALMSGVRFQFLQHGVRSCNFQVGTLMSKVPLR